VDGHCPWKPQLDSSLLRSESNELHVAPVRPPCNQIQTICTAPCKVHATIRCTPSKRRASAIQKLCTKSTRSVQEIDACISLYPIVFKQIQDLPGTWSKPHCAVRARGHRAGRRARCQCVAERATALKARVWHARAWNPKQPAWSSSAARRRRRRRGHLPMPWGRYRLE